MSPILRILFVILSMTLVACPSGEDASAEGGESSDESTDEENGDEVPETEASADEDENEAPESETEEAGDEPAPVSADSIHGAWKMDTDAYVASFPEEEQQAMQQFMGAMQMTMRFGADGTTSTMVNFLGDEQSRDGTWEMSSFEGNVLELDVTLDPNEGEEEGQTDHLIITFDGPNTFSVIMDGEDPETDTLFFVRETE